jgi:glycosyltransferase involved in cell wall biosynthesis
VASATASLHPAPRARLLAREALAGVGVAGLSILTASQLARVSLLEIAVFAGVAMAAGFMALNRRYEVSLALLMLYLGLLDGYVKLKLNTSWATLGRDVLLYAIVVGILLRAAARRERVLLPPLSGWVLAFLAAVLVQVVNPANGWSLDALAATRPHLEFVPLFFLGYATMQSKRRLRTFLLLLVVLAAVNGVVGLIQFNLTPQQFATWGPGYEDRIVGGAGISGRYFADDQGNLRTRPFGLGADQGFSGTLCMLAVPAAIALMLLRRRPVMTLVSGAAAIGVAVGVVTSQARVAVAGAVIAVLAFAFLSSTARRLAPTAIGLGLALALTMGAVSFVTSEGDKAVFRKYDTITPERVVETTVSYRRDTLERIPEYAVTYPFGAGLGSGGPGAGFIGTRALGPALDAESEFTYLLIELGLAGLIVLGAFNLRLLSIALVRLRRLADPETRWLVAAVVAPLFALLATWVVGIATASTPGAPYFWFAAGVMAFWLCGPSRNGEPAGSSGARSWQATTRERPTRPLARRASAAPVREHPVEAPRRPTPTRPHVPPPAPRARGPATAPPPREETIETLLVYRDPEGRVDGIRDYSAVLTEALAEQAGRTDLALVASPRDVRAVPDARNIVLQYNPFAWGDRGVAPALSASVRALRRRRRRPTIALMVHEPFMPFSGVRATAMGLYQRVQLAKLRRASDLAFVSTEPWVELVSRWGPGKPVHLLPVCSALPDRRDRRHTERARLQIGGDELVVATFGTDHPSRLTEYVHLAVGAILRSGHRVVLMNLGAGARSPTTVRRNVRVIAPGELPLEETAALLSTADLFLAPFVDGVSTRRSSVMAALQHALPIVGTLGDSTGDLLGRATDALALTRTARLDLFADAAVSLANEPDARRALGERGRELYERHFAPAVVGRILQEKLEEHRRGHSSR